MTVTIHEGDNRVSLRRLIDEGVRVHSVVTDPPYGLTSLTKRPGAKADRAGSKHPTALMDAAVAELVHLRDAVRDGLRASFNAASPRQLARLGCRACHC